MKTSCANCGIEINKRPAEIKRSKTGNSYCSKSCSNSNNNRLFRQGENNPNFKNGIRTYRSKKLREVEGKCERCGIDDIRVLEVHHIDKNRHNNKSENLRVLCANCHLIEHIG